MGYYIQTPNTIGKAKQIMSMYGAEQRSINDAPPEAIWDTLPAAKAIVVVIHNGLFEAALFAYSKEELQEALDPRDLRPKSMLIMDRDLAERLSGYSQSKHP